ncbi:unnamed protein product [Sympodiomycopsis kandeliae]
MSEPQKTGGDRNRRSSNNRSGNQNSNNNNGSRSPGSGPVVGSDRSSASSAHAPASTPNQPQHRNQQKSPAGGGNGGSRRSAGGGNRNSGSIAGSADPSQAMNNLQHLIQDMKSQPSGGSPGQQHPNAARQGDRDAQTELASLGDRLAAQEEQLQSQLQQQLNLHSAPTGARSSPGGLASVGENVEMASTDHQQQQQQQGAPVNRQSGGRFAGNAALQSAVARHGQSGRSNSQDLRSLSHQRQLSLQGRFAELGYNTGSMGGLSTIPGDYEDALTDDGSSVAEFMGTGGFDPTRGAASGFQSAQIQRVGSGGPGAHRRSGSDASAMGSFGQNRFGGHSSNVSMSGGFSGNSDYVAEQIALQQQIEILQMQQQQLLQQSVNFNPSVHMGGHPQIDRPSHQMGQFTGHRRIQSHAPQSGLLGASFGSGGMGSIGNVAASNASGGSHPQTSAPRGHGRRHSVNVVKGPGGSHADPDQGGGIMQANPAFSFPNTASLQQRQQGQQHQPLTGAGVGQVSLPHRSGHFSHPSVQLASSLSPEYLMAGGGLLNMSTFGMGAELADGFAGPGGMGRGGHSRSGSQNWRINGAPGGPPQVADLAQAQAQLASLHQFRLQASGGGGAGGGGHNKTPSFGGGFNPALMDPSGFNQFGSGFPMGMHPPPQQQGQGHPAAQRKALFGSYLPQASLPPLLAAGKIVVGQIRVDKRNRSDAYVSTEVLDSDIYISGSRDRNRALSGDIVAVELLDPRGVWLSKKAKEDKKKHKEEQGTVSRKSDKAKDDLEVEGAQLRLIDEEEDTEQAPPTVAGHVVAIVERTPGQLFCGTIGLLRPSSAATKEKQQAERGGRDGSEQEQQPRPKIVWHRPLNKTTPLIAIPADQAPAAFWEPGGQEKYATIMVTVAIKRWPITSLHPFGNLVEEIGVMGNVEAETQAILKDNLSTATEDFSENALKCIPPLPYSIPEREFEVRRDFRDECVFTIDPASAKDLDDAVSVKRLDGGLYEIGVHIADVSHFVKPNSALDRDARKRCTSVYLVQRAIPMLPHTLSEELCSLVPGVERLTFSAVFTMNADGRVVGTWFGRTIINSAAKLAYEDAQNIIDGSAPLPAEKVRSHTVDQITDDIQVLHSLAKKMRARRFDEGALRVDNVKLNFKLDENGLPMDATAAQGREANQLIEEFMLAANVAVSQRIAAGLPESALLRRHEPPIERRLEGFKRRAEQMGFDIDISSAGKLYASLKAIKDEGSRFALESLVTNSMQKAKYFSAGMTDISKYGHYALNVPVYTHFTSPIRRYADVMVHRQLEAVLQGHDDFPVDAQGIAKIAQQCNVKKDAAKLAQEQSQHLFLCLLIHDLTVRYGPVVRNATVIGVLDAAFDIIVPEFGIEKRVHLDQIPIEHHTYDEHSNSLSVYWRRGVDTIDFLAEKSDDPHIQALRVRAQQQKDLDMYTQSHQDEAALFDDDDDDDNEALAEAKRRLISGEDAKDSVQRSSSRAYRQEELKFDGIQEPSTGHKIQTVKQLQTVPVVISASVGSKSPPVITVFAVNPFASSA